MKPMRVAEDIVPLSQFKAKLGRVLRDLRTTRRAVVLTQHGRAAAVLVPPEEFDRFRERERFIAAVEEGLADVEAGRMVSDEELGRRLDKRFGKLR